MGVGVNDGVAEMRGVAVGVEEAVFVGIVEVGKGPNRACDVPARAVLIPFISCCVFSLRPKTLLLLKVTAYVMKTRPRHSTI